MKVETIITWGALGCWLLFAAGAMAQPPGDRPGSKSPDSPPDELRSFESIKLWRMTQALDLTEEQAAKIFPKLHQLQKERHQFRQNYRQMMQELSAMVRDPQVQENLLIKKMEQIEKGERAFREMQRKGHEEIKVLLTPVQQAKLMLFQEKFDRDLRQILREIREPKGPPASRRLPPPKTPREPLE